MPKRTDCICLFDVDGTLTEPRKQAAPETLQFLEKLREKVLIGLVGGSDLSKQKEQIGEDCLSRFDFFFSENGLDAYKMGQQIKRTSIKEHLCARFAEPTPSALLPSVPRLTSCSLRTAATPSSSR